MPLAAPNAIRNLVTKLRFLSLLPAPLEVENVPSAQIGPCANRIVYELQK